MPDTGNRRRHPLVAALVAGALLLAAPLASSTHAATPIAGDAQQLLASAPATRRLVVIASTAAVPDAGLVAALRLVGVDAVGFQHLPAVLLRGTAAQLTAAATVPGVTGLWRNRHLEQELDQSVALIQADAVHAAPHGYTGDGVAIAVLDSGIDGTHPDLEYPTKTVQNVKVLGNQHIFRDLTFTVEDVANTDTTTGHGTHVAGIAAGDGTASGGLYAGVAPDASLVGIGAADGVEMLTAMAGYDWILDNHATYGIRVINNSWADGTIEYDPDHPLNQASRAAHDAGIVVVFAAGNGGQRSGDVYNRFAWPDWVVGVGGGTKTGALGDYSSRGNDTHHADLIAPGSFIASTIASTGLVGLPNQSPFDFTDPVNPRVIAPQHIPRYAAKIGTSMAAPHVAGVAALMLEADPTLTPGEVRDILVDTAAEVPGCAVIDCGAGYVNALAAIQAVEAAANEPPVADLRAAPTKGAAPLTVTLNAGRSFDADGTIVAYRFDTDGDGTVDVASTRPKTKVAYAAGVHRPTVTVVDDRGAASAPFAAIVRVGEPPVARAKAPANTRSGRTVTFDGSRSRDPDGGPLTYRFVFGDGHEVTSDEPRVTHAYSTSRTVRLAWLVQVTDDTGLRDGVSGTIRVRP
jgi:serine protease AprX